MQDIRRLAVFNGVFSESSMEKYFEIVGGKQLGRQIVIQKHRYMVEVAGTIKLIHLK